MEITSTYLDTLTQVIVKLDKVEKASEAVFLITLITVIVEWLKGQ